MMSSRKISASDVDGGPGTTTDNAALHPDVADQKTEAWPGYKKIAIVGIGCRMPGDVNSTDAFWDVISNGKDTVSDIPPDRWSTDAFHNPEQSNPGTHVTKRCGFIQGIDQFDHTFFKISPREAAMMDPQQRHTLEVTQEAFDDAGIDPNTLDKRCGVYMGIGMMDYPSMIVGDANLINPYTNTGFVHSLSANRISFAFNLKGPSLAVDTACASSMTALHLACNAIWNKECEVAAVGGSNILLSPEMTVGFSQLGVLSPDGKVRPFDSEANGYVRSEGFGMLIIKPLDAAIADRDHIYCSILGTAIGSNGHNQSITMPSKTEQLQLIQTTYPRFNVSMKDVSYIEAHGTGTPVGDPSEAKAIGEAFRSQRLAADKPLRIGSNKGNFGHMECSSAVVSTIKAALMLHNRTLCPSSNFNKINPAIDLHKLGIEIQQELEPLMNDKKHVFGINSFGFGGALAHTIIEEYATKEMPLGSAGWKFGEDGREGKMIPVPLSAKTDAGLIDLAKKWLRFESDKDAQSIASWLATRRTHFECRIVIIAKSGKDFREKLQRAIEGESYDSISRGATPISIEERNICFVYPGQGQQWAKMGVQLYKNEKIYRESIDLCDTVFQKLSGWSIVVKYGVFTGKQKVDHHLDQVINNAIVSVPAIVFHQIALTNLWKSWGVHPRAAVGHSLGEIAAAFACEGVTLEEAIAVALYRSEEQAKPTDNGGMAATRMSEMNAREFCEKFDDLYVACINSPSSTTIAGHLHTIEKLSKENPSTWKQLRVKSAYHSPYMDRIKEGFTKRLSMKLVNDVEPKIPMYSTVTGRKMMNGFHTQYWWETIRKPVLFQHAVEQLFEDEFNVFVECGASATLLTSVIKTAKNLNVSSPIVITSCQREKDDYNNMLTAAGNLHVNGVSLDWGNITGNCQTWAALPSYPWQHQKHWAESESSRLKRLGLVRTNFKNSNGDISLKDYPFLADHNVLGNVTFPGAGYIEYITQTCIAEDENVSFSEIKFKNVLVFGEKEKQKNVHIELIKKGDHISIVSGETAHMEARISTNKPTTGCNDQPIFPETGSANVIRMNKDEIYKNFDCVKLKYGPAFQVLHEVLLYDGEAIGVIRGDQHHGERIGSNILDGCFQLVLIASQKHKTSAYIPTSIGSIDVFLPRMRTELPLKAWAKIVDVNSFTITADITVFSDNEEIIRVTKLVCQNMDGMTPGIDINNCVYTTSWQPIEANLGSTDIMNYILNPRNLKHNYPEEMKQVESLDPCIERIRGICARFFKRALETINELDLSPSCWMQVTWLKKIVREDSMCINIDDIESMMKDIENACPESQAELRLLWKLGNMLPETLRNQTHTSIDEMLGDDLSLINSLTTRLYEKTTSDLVYKAISQSLQSKKIVRVLEVGCRMDTLAQYLLEPLQGLINAGRVEYTCTMPRSSTLPNDSEIQYKELDVEQSVSTQGFIPHSYDIVVCMDSLSLVLDFEDRLRNVKDLLCPFGWLVIYEASNSQNISNITFGCLERYLVSKQNGHRLQKTHLENQLENSGFKDVARVSIPNDFFHSIIIGVNTNEQCSQNNSSVTNVVIYSEQLSNIDIVDPWEIASSRATLYNIIDSANEPVDVVHLWEEMSSLEDLLDIVKYISNTPNCNSFSVVVDENTISSSIPTGFLRVAVNEIKHIRIYTFRVAGFEGNDVLPEVISIIQHGDIPDSEIMLDNRNSKVPRVMRAEMPSQGTLKSSRWLIDFQGPHAIDNLIYRSLPSEPLSMGDVRIKVLAAGVNFKDIMIATGNLKDLNITPQFGIECTGVVAEAHDSVGNVKVGDRVLAFANNCFASEVVCDSRLLAKLPESIDINVAAGMGIVFSTAYHALVERANLQEGETVLIHSACGGVGQAAIQIATMCGAKIICTAGSNRKRDILREQFRIEHVTNSHSLTFADDVMKWTANKGVDVILNSLSGEYIKKGLKILSHGGRFCEIGKRDILDNSELELNPFLQNKSFLSVQLDVLMLNRPEKMTKLLEKVMSLLYNGDVRPIQTELRDISQYKETLRWMMTGQHIGKVVLKIPMDFSPDNVLPPTEMFTDDGCYLTTGGLGGVGLEVARWIGRKGARHIGLLSRHKSLTFQQRCTMQYLQRLGCQVVQLQADVGDKRALSKIIGELEETTNKPLIGVFHLAGNIDDASIQKLTKTQITQILNSKVDGARNLHELTQNKNLKHFVMFSSLCTVIGNAEQGAYCSANAYLDKLSEHRQSVGLPSLAVQFGAIRGAGFLERNAKVTNIMDTRGLLSLHINECINFLEKAMRCTTTPAVIGFSNADWNLIQGMSHPSHMQFRHLQKVQTQKKVKCQNSREDLHLMIITKLSEILCTSAETIDENKPMTDYGVDSLTAVEMVQWVNKELGMNISQLDILGGMSTGSLVDKAMKGKIPLSEKN